MFWRALSLRSKLLLLALAGVFAVSLLAWWQVNQGFQSRQNAHKVGFKTRAAAVAQGIADSFQERYVNVQGFSLNSVFATGNKEQMTAFLNGVVSSYQVYDAIVFVDASGKFVASNNKTYDGRALDSKTLEGRSFADTPWFQKAIQGEWSEDKPRGFSGTFVEDFQIDPISSALYGTPQQGLSFSKAVIGNDGKPLGVVTTRASSRVVENVLRTHFEMMRASGIQLGHVMIINREGLLAAEIQSELLGEKGEIKRNPERVLRWNVATQQGQVAAQEVVAGQSGALIEFDRIARSERLWGFFPLKAIRFPEQLSWSVVVSAPTDEIMGDLFFQKRVFYSLLGVFLFGFGLVGYGVGRSLSREYMEFSVKLKDDTLRLVEVGDELNEALRRLAVVDGNPVGMVRQAEEQSRDMALQIESRAAALSESAEALRNMAIDLTKNSGQSVQVTENLRIVFTQLRQMEEAIHSLDELQGKFSAVNDALFKAQLIGFNASIEANRTGSSSPGKSFSSIAQEVQTFSDMIGQVAREIAETVSKSKREMLDLGKAIRDSLNNLEKTASESNQVSSSLPDGLMTIADAVEASVQSIKSQDQVVKSICESVDRVDCIIQRASQFEVDLNRHVQTVRQQSYRIEDIVQEFCHSVRGVRVRSRLKKSSSESVFNAAAEVSPERARADAVDRLAQKMRPRLVVESDGHEPEVSGIVTRSDPNRRAG